MFPFTFKNLKAYYSKALDIGYEFITCNDYFLKKPSKEKLTVVNRIDVDLSVPKAEMISDMLFSLNIRGTFFFRLHSKEYNPASFENLNIIKKIHKQGHEIGYHSEILDLQEICKIDAEKILLKDISFFKDYFDIEIKGVASHGGLTGINNLDFWKNRKAKDFNLNYEAYDNEPDFNLFDNSLYVSDSEWTRWKCYKNGKLIKGDTRSFGDHLEAKPKLIYLLIHPETYYEKYPYQ